LVVGSNPTRLAEAKAVLAAGMLASMELRRFDAVGDFLSVAEPFLVEREAEHNLMLGVASSITEVPEAYSGPPYLAVVTDRGRVVAAALRTPPFRLVLSEVDDPRAIGLLAADWPANELPDVLGPVEHVRAFVEARAALGGPLGTLEMSERVYQLTEVTPIPSIPGRARPATLDDRDLVIAWLEAFRLEAFGEAEPGSVVADADRWLARRGRSLHLWQDGDVVSLAGTGGRTPNGIRIGPVYTPPDARRRGYASALVAAISQAELDGGRRFCFLFTDLANPTANHIYQAIGYAPVRDVEAYAIGPS
jgi:predicted GNAT family acetyltransferase